MLEVWVYLSIIDYTLQDSSREDLTHFYLIVSKVLSRGYETIYFSFHFNTLRVLLFSQTKDCLEF